MVAWLLMLLLVAEWQAAADPSPYLRPCQRGTLLVGFHLLAPVGGMVLPVCSSS